MELRRNQVLDALYPVLLLTVLGTVVLFSMNLVRGYVSIKAVFMYVGTSLLAWGAALVLLRRGLEALPPRIFWLSLGLEALALGVSVLVSSMPAVSFFGSVPRMMGTLTYWTYIALAVGAVVILAGRAERVVGLLRVLMVGALVVVLHSLHEMPGVRGFRPPGLLGNPDFLGNWLVAVVFSGIGLTLYDSWRPGALLAGLGAAVAFVGVVFTQTRGAWLGLAVGTVLFFVALWNRAGGDRRLRWRLGWWSVAVVVVSLLFLGVLHLDWAKEAALAFHAKRYGASATDAAKAAYVAKLFATIQKLSLLAILGGVVFLAWSQVASRWRDWSARWRISVVAGALAVLGFSVLWLWKTPSGNHFRKTTLRLHFENEGRKIIWRDTVKGMVPHYWYKGCGIETFRVAFLPYKSIDLAINGPKQNWRNPHNVILYELTSNGILGLGAFLFLLIVAFRALWRAYSAARGHPIQLLVVGLAASLTAQFAHNLVNYDVVPTGMTFYLNLALAQVLLLVAMKAGSEAGDEISSDAREADEDSPSDSTETPPARQSKKKGRRTGSKKAGSPEGQETWGRNAGLLVAGLVASLLPAVLAAVVGGRTPGWLVWPPILLWGPYLAVWFLLPSWQSRPEPRTVARLALGYGILWLALALPAAVVEEIRKGLERDPLRWLLGALVDGTWLVLLADRGHWLGPQADRLLLRGRLRVAGSLGAGLALFVLAGWYGFKHLDADWHLQRARGHSRQKVPRLARGMRQVQSRLRMVRFRIQKAASDKVRAALKQQEDRLLAVQDRIRAMALRELQVIRSNGRRAASHFTFMGFFHHKYSRALQSLLKQPGLLPHDVERKLAEEMVAQAEQGVRNTTNPESAYSHLAVAYYWSMRFCEDLPPGDRQACRQEYLAKSKKALRKSMAHDRYYYDTKRMMAYILTREGKLHEALRYLREAEHIIRGRLHKFPTVADVDDMVADAILRKAYAAAKKGAWDEAIRQARSALSEYGEPLAQAHLVLGRALMRKGLLQEAEEELRTAVRQRKATGYPAAELDLARALAKQGRTDEALDRLARLLRPRVREPQALLVRAWIRRRQGDLEGALADYQRFLSLRPRWPQAKKIREQIRRIRQELAR